MTAALIRPVSPFAAATLAPLPLLALAGLLGGIWALLALLCMTLLRMTLDALVTTAGPGAAPGAEFPASGRLSKALALAHFPLLALGVAAVSGATGLGFWDGLAAFLAFGMYLGQVSTSNAHELIHRTDRLQHALGKWVLISLLYGHHVTAHLKVHHRFVATPDDPGTARLGEGFWSFLPRAWMGAFVAGWEIERSAAAVAGRPLPWWRHPYAEYLAGGAAFAIAFAFAFGASGLLAFLLLAGYAQLQLILSDYVQHYGLRRRRVGDDGWEPVAPWHSWNGTHWFSGGLMLNAPRHSEHHTNPSVPFPELSLPPSLEGPRLPHSLPTMGAIALVPPLWRRMMDRRAAGWQARIDEGRLRRSPRPEPLPTDARRAAGATPEPGMRAPLAQPAEAGPSPAAEPVPGDLHVGAMPADLTRPAGRQVMAGTEPRPEDGATPARVTVPMADKAAAVRPSRPPDATDDHRTGGADRASPVAAGSPPAGPGSAFAQTVLRPPDGGNVANGSPHRGGSVPDGPGQDGGEPDVEAAVAALLRKTRSEQRRHRARFPAIEADPDEPAASARDRARELAVAGRLAARALAALLRGAPPAHQ